MKNIKKLLALIVAFAAFEQAAFGANQLLTVLGEKTGRSVSPAPPPRSPAPPPGPGSSVPRRGDGRPASGPAGRGPGWCRRPGRDRGCSPPAVQPGPAPGSAGPPPAGRSAGPPGSVPRWPQPTAAVHATGPAPRRPAGACRP